MKLALMLAWKDLHIELRSKKRLSVLVLFSFVLIFVGSFAYRWQENSIGYLPPLLWLVSIFAQLLFLSEAYHHEMENECFDALRISPVDGYVLFLGKLLASLAIVLSVNLAVVLEIAFFTSAPQVIRGDVFLLLVLESVGLLSLGNLFFARMASGESMSIELYPLVITLSVPLVFLTMEISQLAFRNSSFSEQATYYFLLVLYDLFLLGACSLAYRAFIDD